MAVIHLLIGLSHFWNIEWTTSKEDHTSKGLKTVQTTSPLSLGGPIACEIDLFVSPAQRFIPQLEGPISLF